MATTYGTEAFVVTRNACKLCTPLGAAFAFKGVERSITILHGSQGCSTYIRRYLISHFREPIDIASSNFTENTAVFGGKQNLMTALDNIWRQYKPRLIGVASTCLTETIGEDTPGIVREWNEHFIAAHPGVKPPYVCTVGTPSYKGTHRDGFQATLLSLVSQVCKSDNPANGSDPEPAEAEEKASATAKRPLVNLIAGMVSCSDLRFLRDALKAFQLDGILLPDYADALDGGLWSEYHSNPPGGTPVRRIAAMKNAVATVELGALPSSQSAGMFLKTNHDIPLYSHNLPIGIRETDRFMAALSELSGKPLPQRFKEARDRLADSYADAHKYIFEIPCLLYGEEDFVVGMASFLAEIGMIPAVCASGSASGLLESRLREVLPDYDTMDVRIASGSDFIGIEEVARERDVKLVVGNSKGYKTAKNLGIPLVRAGFPIHDRFGGHRILHLGYEGAQNLFDLLVNTVLENIQDGDDIGYTYF